MLSSRRKKASKTLITTPSFAAQAHRAEIAEQRLRACEAELSDLRQGLRGLREGAQHAGGFSPGESLLAPGTMKGGEAGDDEDSIPNTPAPVKGRGGAQGVSPRLDGDAGRELVTVREELRLLKEDLRLEKTKGGMYEAATRQVGLPLNLNLAVKSR